MVGHELAPERERILPRRVCQLVDEALEIDRVLVEIDAAPEAGRNGRIAHRVIDQQRRKGVADRGLGSGWVQALEHDGVLAILAEVAVAGDELLVVRSVLDEQMGVAVRDGQVGMGFEVEVMLAVIGGAGAPGADR